MGNSQGRDGLSSSLPGSPRRRSSRSPASLKAVTRAEAPDANVGGVSDQQIAHCYSAVMHMAIMGSDAAATHDRYVGHPENLCVVQRTSTCQPLHEFIDQDFMATLRDPGDVYHKDTNIPMGAYERRFRMQVESLKRSGGCHEPKIYEAFRTLCHRYDFDISVFNNVPLPVVTQFPPPGPLLIRQLPSPNRVRSTPTSPQQDALGASEQLLDSRSHASISSPVLQQRLCSPESVAQALADPPLSATASPLVIQGTIQREAPRAGSPAPAVFSPPEPPTRGSVGLACSRQSSPTPSVAPTPQSSSFMPPVQAAAPQPKQPRARSGSPIPMLPLSKIGKEQPTTPLNLRQVPPVPSGLLLPTRLATPAGMAPAAQHLTGVPGCVSVPFPGAHAPAMLPGQAHFNATDGLLSGQPVSQAAAAPLAPSMGCTPQQASAGVFSPFATPQPARGVTPGSNVRMSSPMPGGSRSCSPMPFAIHSSPPASCAVRQRSCSPTPSAFQTPQTPACVRGRTVSPGPLPLESLSQMGVAAANVLQLRQVPQVPSGLLLPTCAKPQPGGPAGITMHGLNQSPSANARRQSPARGLCWLSCVDNGSVTPSQKPSTQANTSVTLGWGGEHPRSAFPQAQTVVQHGGLKEPFVLGKKAAQASSATASTVHSTSASVEVPAGAPTASTNVSCSAPSIAPPMGVAGVLNPGWHHSAMSPMGAFRLPLHQLSREPLRAQSVPPVMMSTPGTAHFVPRSGAGSRCSDGCGGELFASCCGGGSAQPQPSISSASRMRAGRSLSPMPSVTTRILPAATGPVHVMTVAQLRSQGIQTNPDSGANHRVIGHAAVPSTQQDALTRSDGSSAAQHVPPPPRQPAATTQQKSTPPKQPQMPHISEEDLLPASHSFGLLGSMKGQRGGSVLTSFLAGRDAAPPQEFVGGGQMSNRTISPPPTVHGNLINDVNMGAAPAATPPATLKPSLADSVNRSTSPVGLLQSGGGYGPGFFPPSPTALHGRSGHVMGSAGAFPPSPPFVYHSDSPVKPEQQPESQPVPGQPVSFAPAPPQSTQRSSAAPSTTHFGDTTNMGETGHAAGKSNHGFGHRVVGQRYMEAKILSMYQEQQEEIVSLSPGRRQDDRQPECKSPEFHGFQEAGNKAGKFEDRPLGRESGGGAGRDSSATGGLGLSTGTIDGGMTLTYSCSSQSGLGRGSFPQSSFGGRESYQSNLGWRESYSSCKTAPRESRGDGRESRGSRGGSEKDDRDNWLPKHEELSWNYVHHLVEEYTRAEMLATSGYAQTEQTAMGK
eukprot:gnl/TRDRNA2_/TRDRNA2_85021_c0_seq1.p1 gnl/TRDRNA2_/TRDRNA2_85021_c0~~gnl/TRDRNA2_/TRDRNA2_85021_c0_seq1.p1  ORF type:complete len:1282 (+),score=145.80 gnl/TRDRNA2_/TRDRNA2_85021_c0_seq1:67-3912(+)